MKIIKLSDLSQENVEQLEQLARDGYNKEQLCEVGMAMYKNF